PLLPSTHPSRGSSGARHRKTSRCPVCQRPLASADRNRGQCADCVADVDPQVFDALRAWRTTQVAHDNVPAYVVFNDATLRAIAIAKPASLEALATVHGVGPKKLELYGSQVLE